MDDKNLLKILEYISPAECDYQEWVNVGMALKHEGFSADDWDVWSRADSRYHPGECHKKWNSFNGSDNPVTAGTIVQMAKEKGYIPSDNFREYDWDDEIAAEENRIVCNSDEGIKITEPENWDPVSQIVTYLETLFDANENVGYVTETWEKSDGDSVKYLPTKGSYDRTAGELIELLNKCDGDIGAVLGDCKPEAGAWIRFNPLDGKGVKNENVTDFRYALVESDSMPIERQNAVIRELELPVAVLVYSGGKSVHAIVRIDAKDFEEYRKRVAYLFDVCEKNGLKVDKSCKNPSRLSRLPGVTRNGKKQFIIDTNIGKEDFAHWQDWIEGINDDLPDLINLSSVWDDLPELSVPIIDGVLRKGHKMLITGPSKAGKSFALIELSIAFAEGTEWFGFRCTRGRVMYVNLELDEASCFHRFHDVYKSMNICPEHFDNIDIWNLRGHSIPMDKLAPKLIRRALKQNYIAVIIDPIYKVITGDENSADQMAHFCNQFDKVCNELGSAVIYCHHHSKGGQGGKKAVDRASGSGVFARDPDAIIDIAELEMTDSLLNQQKDEKTCAIALDWLSRFKKDDLCSQDDIVIPKSMMEIARENLPQNSFSLMFKEIKAAEKAAESRTAWRVEGTLREFPKFRDIDMWFDYPVHRRDDTGVLKDCQVSGLVNNWKQNFSKKRSDEQRKEDRKDSIITAFNLCQIDGKVTLSDLAAYLGKSEKTVRRYVNEHEELWIDNNEIGLKNPAS